ncbi:3'(2'),5'-bisphosphate nucleotidase CysQ [Teredinibacter haidensis]|uniref:3'(2'),5'-bisphosphate nucleotidase CysQ n=1 Tax=Teredinibacter haidensis TaxID=2731755 RepID=UPI000948F665|nr:3'(2'),5'-bisphosphate nucleotidase CysQ [Teredinibacter haidensis]
MLDQNLLSQVIEICQAAGEAILEVYHSDECMGVESKADDSPVTRADIAAHEILLPALAALLPNVPVLSEESELPDYAQRQVWNRYWLIDPLDGTKEFIHKNDEFTVNVALIENHQAVLGVVYVPVSNVVYSGITGVGAWKTEAGATQAIESRSMANRIAPQQAIEVVASRHHGASEIDPLMHRIRAAVGEVQTKSMGSSLKLCLVAEGKADLYPRLALTSEWDTAAAQAIVEAAGGCVLDDKLQPLRYNTKDDILNPYFYVIGDTQFNWKALLLTA